MIIELYLNNKLCDIGDINKFSVLLDRQFVNPAVLSETDTQYSYAITIPFTRTNINAIGYRNVEEVNYKFDLVENASLIVDNVCIIKGSFMPTEISYAQIKGNLVVVSKKSIKDVFEDLNMNQAGEWKMEFGKFCESVNTYNNTPNSPLIFPYVLYGLLPKQKRQDGEFSGKNTWDNTVLLGVEDFPPSINCIEAIKKLFKNKGYNLSGSALSDERLTSLYMSYSNPTDYQMPFNWGLLGKVSLSLEWSNYKNCNTGDRFVEPTMVFNNSPKIGTNYTRGIYNTDLISNFNSKLNSLTDEGANLIEQTVLYNNKSYQARSIVIPYSGYYKVELDAGVNLLMEENYYLDSFDNKMTVISPTVTYNAALIGQSPSWKTVTTKLPNTRSEIKVIRDFGDGDFDFESMDIDREFYADAINQTNNFDTDNYSNFPKYFPRGGELCLIDPKQDKRLICGLSFGTSHNKPNQYDVYNETPDQLKFANAIALKGGLSFDREDIDFYLTATNNKGYVECVRNENMEVVYADSNKFKVDVLNTDYENAASITEDLTGGTGRVQTLVWLEKGERITIAHSCNQNQPHLDSGALMQDVRVDFSLTPFQKDEDWMINKLNTDGSTKAPINWQDVSDFTTNHINLIEFLPSTIKVDSWIDNFCKAFNLKLIQTSETEFELNVRQKRSYGYNVVDLDSKVHVNLDRTNTPLGLPSVYKLGFTIDEDEQGYIETHDNGGGEFSTGNKSGSELEQTSSFSYCWYKDIICGYDIYYGPNGSYMKPSYIDFPIISDKEPFELEDTRDYAEMQQKDYSSAAQRFWYHKGSFEVTNFPRGTLNTALVSNELNLWQADGSVARQTLDYHNKANSILDNYFTTFTNNKACYTNVECYLTPEEYNRLPNNYVKFNGDLYITAAVDGYDPTQRQRTKLKLIKKYL